MVNVLADGWLKPGNQGQGTWSHSFFIPRVGQSEMTHGIWLG